MMKKEFNTYASPASVASFQDSAMAKDFSGGDVAELHENHTLYGTLRKGGIPRFMSWSSAGLWAATFSSVFSYNALQTVTRPLIATQLALSRPEQLAVQRLVELPMALSFLIGLLSDCYPIFGLRRKAYMILGLVLNAIGTLAIGAIAAYFESLDTQDRSKSLVWLVIIMTAVASFGCMFTYLCVHTRTVELSQQEPLGIRGSFLASYSILRRLASLFTGVFTYLVLGDNARKPNIALSTSLFIMVGICVAPLPMVVRFWKEEHYSLPVSFKVRGQIFWKIMQQKAVWRTITFVAMFGLFLTIKMPDSTNIIRSWAGAATDNSLVVRVISDGVQLLVLIVWRFYFMNRPWRTFFLLAPLFLVIPTLVISALVAFGTSRDRYLYRTVISMTLVSDGINVLNNIVPITEIVQEGSEGVMMGLVLSLQRLIGVFVNTNAQGLFRGDNFYNLNEVSLDNSHIHKAVFLSLVFICIINLVGVFGVFFLPAQKLDAQQMRMYGGFTKVASSAMVVFALVLFLYSMVINTMTFIPSTGCTKIVGGKGC